MANQVRRGCAAARLVLLTGGLVALVSQNLSALPSYSRAGSGETETFHPGPAIRHLVGNYSPEATNGDGFVTFPLIRSVPIEGARMGTLGGGGSSDWPITNATAYLYEAFARGSLPGFRYHTKESERALKEAIWYFEGQTEPSSVEGNSFVGLAVDFFGTLEQAMSTYTGRSVRVIELVEDSRFDKSAPVYGKGPSDAPSVQRALLLTNDTEDEIQALLPTGGYGMSSNGGSSGFVGGFGGGGSGGNSGGRSEGSPGPVVTDPPRSGTLSPGFLPPGGPQDPILPQGQGDPVKRGKGTLSPVGVPSGGLTPPPPHRVPESGPTFLMLGFTLVAIASLRKRHSISL